MVLPKKQQLYNKGGQIMFCGKCGSAIPDGNSFCGKCGTPIPDFPKQFSEQVNQQSVQQVPVIMVAQPVPVVKSNSAAIVGLIFGIIGLCLCWVPFVWAVLGVIGLILSVVGVCKINECHSGTGSAVTGLVFSFIGVIVGAVLAVGLNTYLNKAQTAYDKDSHKSAKPNIEMSIQNICDIRYEAPSSWNYRESGMYKYYYPDKNDTNVFLMVFHMETEAKSPTDDDFEVFLDGIVEGFTSDDEIQTHRVVSRKIEKKNGFYLGLIDLKVTADSKYREMYFYVALDVKTGKCYCFLFTQPESISEENKKVFNYVTETIELR